MVSIKQGNNITAKAGQKVTLNAVASDPDKDKLTYCWWRYFEADSYKDEKRPLPEVIKNDIPGTDLLINMTRELLPNEQLNIIELKGANKSKMSFIVPADAKKGDTIHIILSVKDDGDPPLIRCSRVIVTVD